MFQSADHIHDWILKKNQQSSDLNGSFNPATWTGATRIWLFISWEMETYQKVAAHFMEVTRRVYRRRCSSCSSCSDGLTSAVLKCLFLPENTQNKYDRFHQTGLKAERRWMWNTDADLFDLNVDFLVVWVLLCRVCQCCSVENGTISCDNNVTPSHLKKKHVK